VTSPTTILLLYWIHLIFQILVPSRQQLKLLAYGSQLESYISVLCCWFVVFRHSLNLQNLVSSTKYILTPLVYHTKKSRLFTLISSLRLLPHNLLSFGSLGTKINKSKSVAFAAHSNYNFQTQESINILKTKQNKTTITILRVAMQIRTNCGRNEDTK
jgi:hypothetical protein